MDIGKRIKELRKERNLTQKQFGQLVHKSSQVVSNWERGYTTGITAEDLQAIAHAFGIPEGEILNDGTSAEPPTGLTARDERDIERFDPVKAIFDDSDVRSLARDRLKGVSKEEIALKKQQLKAMVAAMWMKEENEK